MKRFLIGSFAALVALAAKAEEPFAAFVKAESGESAAVRLECRGHESIVARVVTGVVPTISPAGIESTAWDTAKMVNGWHEVKADGEDAVATQLLVLNAPDYKVEGGRLTSSTTWTSDSVHWVRNWVVVPSGVTLTVKEGTIVKFGEQTGIKVENGGTVDFQGKSDARIVLTHFADDVYGGDSDFGKTNAWYGAWSVTAVSGGTVNDVYTHVRYGTVGTLPTISMPASVTAQRIEGKARIPVTFSEVRTDRMTLHWRAIDGTATFGTDYAKQEGEEVWSNSAEATQYFTIPLLESDDEEVKIFRIELVSVEDCNPTPTRLETTVTIISGKSVPIAVSAESAESAAVRLESRPETMVGRALVCGTEWKSANGESRAETWDTTPLGHGWHSLTATAGGDGVSPSQARILALNDAKIAVEGGRLTANTKWDNGAVHVVRNQVVVPSGVTLTIGEGTVVKFAEVTGIKVEDGGAVNLEGKSAARVVLTSLADDAFGGDTDLIETNGVYGSWSIAAVGSGAISDAYTYVRYGTIPSLPTLTMPASATAQRSEGKVRIPITLNGTRSNRMAIHWRTHDGTAKHGVDFTETEGEATWSNASSTTVYLEIPLITESDADGVKTFEVEVVSAEDINIDSSRLVTKVTIVTGSLVPIPTCAVSESSEAVRLEARTEGMVGKAAVSGKEWKAADGESRAEEWDTTPLGYGWQTLDDGHGTNAQVLALNDGKIAVEGGRLTANAAWNSNVVHLVRNTVIVPNGVTLSVTTNAVVKFCENTGIKVEEGGSLIVVGSTNEPAVFTVVTDDEVGGDTDKRTIPASNDLYSITVISGGTFTDRNAAFRHVVMSNHATLSLPTGCEINESEKQVQIPVSVSGSRSTPFRVFWRAIDDTAKYPDDYPIREGVVEWNSTSDGTRFITVPVNDDGEEEETEQFKVELYDAQGANISRTAFVCMVTVRDSTATLVPVAVAAESEASAAVRLENRPEGTLGKAVVHGAEFKAAGGTIPAVAWDTTKEGEGWQMLTATDDPTATANVLVRNDPKVAVEGGRLETTTIWDSNAVHLVRNMVIVPSGVTLSVTTNAVVKFCENTGVKVEAGGRFQLLGSLDENVYMTLANDDTVGGDTDKDEEREWVEGAATYSVNVVSGGTFTDMNSVIRGTTIGTFGYASVNAKTVVDATEGVIRIPVFVNGSRTTQFSVDWKTSDGLRGQLIWGNVNEGTKWVTLNVADCSEKFKFELCECRGINIDGAAKVSEVSVFRNATPLAISAESESSAAVRFENRADGTFGKALCFGTEWKSVDGDSRAEAWDTTQEENNWIDLGEGMKLLVRNDADLAVEGGRLMPTYEVINTNGVDVTNWNYTVNWTSDKVHIVRNWVVVPNGMTLAIAAGTVVKFAEFAGFKVEAGGRLYVEGTVDAPVVYTAAADDTIGGDTDKREVEPQYGDYSMNIVSGGTYSDRNCAIRYATFANLGTATLPATAIANEKDGVVRVPMFINTSRTTAFCVDWRVASGTYATKGRLNWNTYTEGTKYIEIPLTPGTIKGEFDTFEIEMYESQGINVSTTERKCVVTIYPDKKFPEEIAFAHSAESAAVRMENRDPLWSYGAEIVCGTELKSANGESRAEPWDTTQESDGWFEVRNDGASPSDPAEFQLLVRNDESVAVEGGRLNGSTTWGKDKVHIVRNWVVVPNGVTLTITAGTIVKFCDETGIKVEAGGRLVSAGTSAADVILTSINDDTVGGDTDFDEVEAEHGDYRIDVVSGGTFTDTYTQMRYGESGTFGSVSIASDVVAKKDGGIVRIPLTISTSRTTPFSVDWVAHDGTAIYGEDYLCASGRIDWTSSSQGTKYLEIPLDRLSPTAEDEWFEVELITGLGINLNLNATLCEVELYDTKDTLIGDNNGYAESAWATPIEVDGLAGSTYPLFAQPEEIISYSTLWQTNGVDGAVVKVAYEDMEGNVYDFLNEAGSVEGQTKWKVGEEAYGRYRFRHQVLDEDGKQLEIQSQDFIVSDVIEHGGAIRADETWGAGHVHVVRETVTVLRGATLTIEPGAIVKFFPGTGITTQDDGECIANGAQFTHVADDQLGGDTFFDGGITSPGLGEYTLSGNVRTDVGTETRYAKAQVVSANISTDTTWGSHTVYHITKSITITKPAVLTIQAGAVVKLADGVRIIVNSGATLDVQGTRAAPVVFTSIKDDEFGGDSNQDGSATAPNNGIWDEILNSGTLRMTYAHVLYGGYGLYSNQGDAAIRNTGGTAMLDGCVVEGSDLRLLGLSGGTMTVRNSVLRDGRWGWDGNVTFVNGVVENCTTGASGGKATNTIFWNCPTAMSGTTQKNCVAFECDGGVGAATVADPKFVDGPAGDYRIGRDSPCVDAGDEESAPEADYYGQSRAGAPDVGLYEVQLRETKVDVDLAAVSASAAERATIGGNLTVTWSVRNVGSMVVADAWRDRLELIDANGATVVLGTYTVTGGLAADGARVFTGNFRVPSMSPGAARLRLKVNAERDVFEGSQTDNNVISAENTVQIALPSYTSDDYSKLTLASGTSMALSVAPDDGITALIIRGGTDIAAFGATGYVPAGLRYDVAATRLADGSLLLSIPSSAEGDFMFTVENGGASSATVEIETVKDALWISEVTPMRASNTGDAYVTIRGVGLDAVASVRLEGASTYSAQHLQASSPSELSAQFNLNGAFVGTYSVVVETEDGTTARLGGFEIYKPKMGPKLEARLEIPGTVRQGRIYTGKIVYSNVGDEDMLAPYFVVEASDADLQLNDDGFNRTSLCVLGIAASDPVGVLKQGESSSIAFTFRSGAAPRFKLHTDSDNSPDWDALHVELAEAATVLNRRGRAVIERDDIEQYIEFKKNNPESVAISGKIVSQVSGTSMGGMTVMATYTIGDEVFNVADNTDENGVFIIDGIQKEVSCKLSVRTGAANVTHEVEVGTSDLNNQQIFLPSKKDIHAAYSGLPVTKNAVVNVKDLSGELLAFSSFGDGVVDISVWTEENCLWLETLDSGYARLDPIIFDMEEYVGVDIDNENALTRLSGVICDKDSNTLSNVVVRLRDEYELMDYSVTSDGLGRFRFDGIVPGAYNMSCSLNGYETILQSVTVDDGCDENLVVSLLHKPGSVLSGSCGGIADWSRIVLRNSAGKVVDSVIVENGCYEFVAVEAGTYKLMAVDEDGWPLTPVQDVSVVNSDLTFDIDKALFYRVNMMLDEGKTDASYSLIDAYGYFKELKIENGKCQESLMAGRYWVVASRSDGSEESKLFVVDGDCAVTFNWQGTGAIGWRETERGWPLSVCIFKDGTLIRQVDGDDGVCEGLFPGDYRVIFEFNDNHFAEANAVSVQKGLTIYASTSACTREITVLTEGAENVDMPLAYLMVESEDGLGVTIPWKKGLQIQGFPADVGTVTVKLLDADYNVVARKVVGEDGVVVLNMSNFITRAGEIQCSEDVLLAFVGEDGQSVDVYVHDGAFSSDYVPSNYQSVYIGGSHFEICLSKAEFESLGGKIDVDALMPRKVSVVVVANENDVFSIPDLTITFASKLKHYWDYSDSIREVSFNLCAGDYELAVSAPDGAQLGHRKICVGGDEPIIISLDSFEDVNCIEDSVPVKMLKNARLLSGVSYTVADTRHTHTHDMQKTLRSYQEALERMVKEEVHCDCGYNDKVYHEYVIARLRFAAELSQADSYVESIRQEGVINGLNTANAAIGAWGMFNPYVGGASLAGNLAAAVEELLSEGFSWDDILTVYNSLMQGFNDFVVQVAVEINGLEEELANIDNEIGIAELELDGQSRECSRAWSEKMEIARERARIKAKYPDSYLTRSDYKELSVKYESASKYHENTKVEYSVREERVRNLKTRKGELPNLVKNAKAGKWRTFVNKFKGKFKVGAYGKIAGRLLTALNYLQVALDVRDIYVNTQKLNDRREYWGTLYLPSLAAAYDRFQRAYLKSYHSCKGYSCPVVKVVDNDGVSQIAPYVPPSRDPNEVAGPLGVGENRYVKPGAWMDYTVYFENASDAEAAALDIYVTNPLSEWLDWSTFEMGDVSFNNQIDSNLRGAKTKSNEVPQNGTTYYVNSSVAFDEKKGVVNVELHIVDHTTKYGVPEDPYAGILPPNDETHCGEGYFSYRVRVREDAPANARIENSASIVFDYNPPIETDPAWWNTVYAGGEAEFDAEELKVDEGGTLKVVVSGGNMETASSVQLAVQYNTAAAADLDLKGATVNGAKPSKALAFPVTLSWKAGEIGEKTVEIPVKKDTAVENDEFLTLQLSKPSGLELSEASVCTVCIHDPGYDALKAKVEGETATKKEKDAWTKLQKAQLPYVRSLAEPAHMGKVSGYGKFAKGKKVTLKATAGKGHVFAGWYLGGELVSKSASYSFKATGEDADYRARFVTLAEDKASIGATVNGMAFGAAAGDGGSMGGSTNAMCGVVLFWPLSHEALSATSVKVTGLPKGLKYDTKKKAITGTPTAPGKTSSVKVVVTTAGKQKATFVLKVTVDPLPEWARGQFTGRILPTPRGEDAAGTMGSALTMTVGSTGKVSGKFKDGITNWTFSASSFATNSVTAGETNLFCRATAKGTYKNAKKKTVTVSAPIAFELVARPDVSPIAAEGLGDFADGMDNVEIWRMAGVRISVGEAGGGTVKMDKSYGQVASNKTVKLTATVKKGYAFLGWYDVGAGDTEPVSQATSYALVSDSATDRFLEARFIPESALKAADVSLDWNAPTNIYVGVSYLAQPKASGTAAVKIASVSGLPKGLSWKSGKVSGVPTTEKSYAVKVKVALTTNSKKAWTISVPIEVRALPEWATGTFVGGMAEGVVSNQVTVTVGKTGKVSGKLCDASGAWTLSASSLAAYVPAVGETPEAFTAKVTGKNGKKSRTFEITVTGDGIVGFLTSGQETASLFFAAWRNVWKTELADLAAELALRDDLQVADDLVLRFGANGAVTGVLTVGKNTFACTTTLVPEEDAYRAYLYFAPNSKKKFKGEVRVAEVTP